MELAQAIKELQTRVQRPRGTNLIYLCFPVQYTPNDPAVDVARELGVEPLSVIALLVDRFGAQWERLLAAESDRRTDGIGERLRQDLVARVQSAGCSVICDTDVLYAFPALNPSAFLYPLSTDHVIVVSVKADHVAAGLRLLGDGPIYPVDNCTVLEIAAIKD